MNKKFCPRCHSQVELETDKDLKKEYKYVCYECDENFYTIEVRDENEVQSNDCRQSSKSF
jgi:ribosomal protein L33